MDLKALGLAVNRIGLLHFRETRSESKLAR
jgi:hypothetical protein